MALSKHITRAFEGLVFQNKPCPTSNPYTRGINRHGAARVLPRFVVLDGWLDARVLDPPQPQTSVDVAPVSQRQTVADADI
jgi:hypothetical protein